MSDTPTAYCQDRLYAYPRAVAVYNTLTGQSTTIEQAKLLLALCRLVGGQVDGCAPEDKRERALGVSVALENVLRPPESSQGALKI